MNNTSAMAEQGQASPITPAHANSTQHATSSSAAQVPGASSRAQSTNTGNSSRTSSHWTTRPKYLSDATKGWPLLAAKQSGLSGQINGGIVRNFDFLFHRVLIDEQTKLCSMGADLWKMDLEDEDNNSERLRTLSFDKKRLLSPDIPCHTHFHCAGDEKLTQDNRRRSSSLDSPSRMRCQYVHNESKQDPKDAILERLLPRLIRYGELVLLISNLRNLHKVSSRASQDLLKQLHLDALDEEAVRFLREGEDDFISTRTKPFYEPLEWLLYYRRNSFVERLCSSVFRFIFKMRGESAADPHSDHINAKWLQRVSEGILALFSIVILCSPVAILLLASLSKETSLAVVVGFGFAFVIVMTSMGVKFDTVLVGLSAYMAVLVTFLANLQQCHDG
ncbi:uncharacterized protein BCR38DRAFT_480171 [Pseudomassariella vexata]|uniref:DUF6594 domain-containing protein n=1 Tax=Pseudomassariella vexata TaxID=1141098 RepID=A0A1Y2EJD1_9PEZI|nr:uncharacterized protein BCR38DRAFT_480171 [Pseudomassariella vexata]ORY71678.1 hypothetical protein BCR38DRAFT_480171 [Pseudomassariella vexata]